MIDAASRLNSRSCSSSSAQLRKLLGRQAGLIGRRRFAVFFPLVGKLIEIFEIVRQLIGRRIDGFGSGGGGFELLGEAVQRAGNRISR